MASNSALTRVTAFGPDAALHGAALAARHRGERVEARERLGLAVGVEGFVARHPAVGAEDRERTHGALERTAAFAPDAGGRGLADEPIRVERQHVVDAEA